MEVKEKFKNLDKPQFVTFTENKRATDNSLYHFVNHGLLQMLELLEGELYEAFDGVEFWYKGKLNGVEFTANRPEKWTSQFTNILPFVAENSFTIQFSIFCCLPISEDVQFWGYTINLSFARQTKQWYLQFGKESVPVNRNLPICDKRLLLRHIYFHILDDYNNNY